MRTLYPYIGPSDIAARVWNAPAGCRIESLSDLLCWLRDQEVDQSGCIIATFVVDESGLLRLADRHSEHVACAGGRPVLSAGEIAFRLINDGVSEEWVTNQSTGYCPEPESWPEVETALQRSGIEPPDAFSPAFIFRRCNECGSINIVKDDFF